MFSCCRFQITPQRQLPTACNTFTELLFTSYSTLLEVKTNEYSDAGSQVQETLFSVCNLVPTRQSLIQQMPACCNITIVQTLGFGLVNYCRTLYPRVSLHCNGLPLLGSAPSVSSTVRPWGQEAGQIAMYLRPEPRSRSKQLV